MHANDFDLGAHRFDVVGHPRNQAAAANSHKHRMQRPLVLAQHFHGNRALAGNHIRVVKRVDKGQALFFLQRGGVGVCIRVTVAKQHHLAAQAAHRIHLELRRGGWHHDHGARAQLVRTECHALRMVAGRGADHTFFELLRAQLHHLVVSAAQLETAHRLLVFALEQHRVVQPPPQSARRLQRRLDRHVIDTGCQDFFQVVGGLEGSGFACHK